MTVQSSELPISTPLMVRVYPLSTAMCAWGSVASLHQKKRHRFSKRDWQEVDEQ